MVIRSILIGVVLIACGKSEGTKQAAPAAAPAPVEQGQPPAAQPPSMAAQSSSPAAEPPTPAAQPPAAGPGSAGSNASKDKPVAASSQSEVDALEKAIAPYIEQAKRSFPGAKKRFLAGLPAGHKFAIATKLHSPGKVETVFVMVQRIEGNKITGRIDSDVRAVTGYKTGDSYTLPESDLIDWVIVRPDGSEEGNAVGKFLDTWQSQQHH